MSNKIRSFTKLKEGETLEDNVEIYEELDYRYIPVQPLQLPEVPTDDESTEWFKNRGDIILCLVIGCLLVFITIVWAIYTLTARGSQNVDNITKNLL